LLRRRTLHHNSSSIFQLRPHDDDKQARVWSVDNFFCTALSEVRSCAIARTTPILASPIPTYSGSCAMPSYLLFQNSQVCCLLPTVPLFFPILSPRALGSLHHQLFVTIILL
jgi:hypothetical protein